MSAKYAIGIDPDKGWAVWDKVDKRFINIETVDFWTIVRNMSICSGRKEDFVFYIETPQDNSPVWHSGKTRQIQAVIDQRVGENKAKAKLILEGLKSYGFEVVECRPGARSMTGLTAKQFKNITGWTGTTSEHGRDAAMLVWKR